MLLDGCPLLDEVLLAVDELVVNALRYTKPGQPGGTFTVEITRWDEAVAVSVTDERAPSEPCVTDAADDAEPGRGLRTVSLMADGWGWFGKRPVPHRRRRPRPAQRGVPARGPHVDAGDISGADHRPSCARCRFSLPCPSVS